MTSPVTRDMYRRVELQKRKYASWRQKERLAPIPSYLTAKIIQEIDGKPFWEFYNTDSTPIGYAAWDRERRWYAYVPTQRLTYTTHFLADMIVFLNHLNEREKMLNNTDTIPDDEYEKHRQTQRKDDLSDGTEDEFDYDEIGE